MAFSPIIIGLCTSPRRFISCAETHIISVLPVPTSWSAMPPPFCFSIQMQSFCEGYKSIMPKPFRSRSGNFWCEPSYFGRTKQLNLSLYRSVRRFLNSGDCSSNHSVKPFRISSIFALASCMPSLSRTLMSFPFSSLPMLFIMSGQVLCRACFSRFMPS